ncbi:MAG: pyridoxal phosphate-dependent aminotransferase [Acidimicrobiales bacterium]
MSELRALARRDLQSAVPYDPGPSVAELEARFGVKSLVKLNWNEDLFGLLPGVAEAVKGELARASLYPEHAYTDFRELVAARSGASPAMVLPAHGIQALVFSTVAAFVERGDKVVIPKATYGLYRQACSSAGAEIVRVPNAGYRIDLPAVIEATEGAKLVFVCDPNNPTGDALSPDEWRQFLGALPEGCVAVADEAYADYMTSERRPDRVADVTSGRPVVVLRTFSKLYGLAGLRLGYGLVHPDLVPCYDAVQEPFNLNRLSLAAGSACLADPGAVEERRLEVQDAREHLVRSLGGIGIPSWPSEANFVLAEVGGDDGAFYEGLLRKGFLVRPGAGLGYPGHLRITVGPRPMMDALAEAIEAVTCELGRASDYQGSSGKRQASR